MDVMIDLETLSSAPDAAIVAIGAATFNDGTQTGFFRQTFYQAIDARSAQAMGGRLDGATISWWLKQPEEARAALLADCKAIGPALLDLTGWLRSLDLVENLRIWGNGASFDNVVLRQAYERMAIEAPWSFRNDRCYRTLKNLRPDVAFEPYGTHHNALDDAFAQAQHAERILAAMKGA